jgi:hypothetical protein
MFDLHQDEILQIMVNNGLISTDCKGYKPTLMVISDKNIIHHFDRCLLYLTFSVRTLGYILFDHKRNEALVDIMDKQLKTTPIIDFVT